MQYDLDASAIPGLKRFEVPLLDVITFAADQRLVDLALRSARRYVAEGLDADVPRPLLAEFGIHTPAVRSGMIVSGDQFIANVRVLNRLRRALADVNLPEPDCVEMEGAAVAQVCYEHKTPMIVVRTISDRADRSAPIDFPRFVAEVAGHFTRGIVKQLIAEI
jgi:adenosylhomocysteine nucleosidase